MNEVIYEEPPDGIFSKIDVHKYFIGILKTTPHGGGYVLEGSEGLLFYHTLADSFEIRGIGKTKK